MEANRHFLNEHGSGNNQSFLPRKWRVRKLSTSLRRRNFIDYVNKPSVPCNKMLIYLYG